MPSVVRFAYLRWMDTQGESAKDMHHALGADARGWLVDAPVMRRRMAPGNTCISGLRGRLGSREDRLNDSKGCGGVMRVAPVGLMALDPYGLGCDLAALTHGHPSGFVAAGAFAVAISALVGGAASAGTSAATHGASLRAAVAAARRAAADDPEGAEVTAAIDAAVAAASASASSSASASQGASAEAVESLGGGWVAEEALAIAFYCVLAEPDPARALLLAVNHSGDSDSTGSMVGQLLGAAHGVGAIPEAWIDALDGRDVVERIAEDFAAHFVDGRELDAYPGC